MWWLLEGTRLGAIVRAGSESTDMVSMLGLNIYRIFSLVFALGAASAALAGVLAAPIRGVDPFMGVEALGIAFVVVVVGGMGSFAGALAGGLLVGIVQSLMSTIWPEGARLMIYVVMATVLLLASEWPARSRNVAEHSDRNEMAGAPPLHAARHRSGRVASGHVAVGIARDGSAGVRLGCARLQPAARLHRPDVVRAGHLLRSGKLHGRV